jgi:tetratricopeptide (TPR) repeat protein
MRPSGQIKMMLGNLHMQRRELSEASDFFAAAVELDPYSTGAWTAYLGALLMGANPRRFQAEAARAMEKLPENSSIRGMRGVAFAMDGQMELAEPLLREALTRDPNLPFLNHALGVVARAREQLDQAEQFYLEEVRLHPPAVTTRRQIIEILAEQKRYEEQLAELEALAPLEPPNHSSAHSKAQVLFNLKRYAEAEPEVQRCMQLSPDYAPCVMLNANVLKKLGREKEGYAEYERALKMVGQSPPAPPATP